MGRNIRWTYMQLIVCLAWTCDHNMYIKYICVYIIVAPCWDIFKTPTKFRYHVHKCTSHILKLLDRRTALLALLGEVTAINWSFWADLTFCCNEQPTRLVDTVSTTGDSEGLNTQKHPPPTPHTHPHTYIFPGYFYQLTCITMNHVALKLCMLWECCVLKEQCCLQAVCLQ